MAQPIKPNAITLSQCARLVGVTPQAVDAEKLRVPSRLEVFDFLGSPMVTMRSAMRWKRAREKRIARVG